ncbi:MAG: hypothetical protein JWP87_2627 [Labilithrix sp.]|nr:hypothetical protein [Labilithrix sp.]
MDKLRRQYSRAVGCVVLLAAAAGPWLAACGTDDAGLTSPTPAPTTTTTTPTATTTTPPPPPPASCSDTKKNGTETDIDCGGSCLKCADAKACLISADCASGNCDATTKKCTAPSCADVVKNGTETDVDCGGSCTTKCANTKACAVNADCISLKCDATAKKCVAAGCTDTIKNGTETDVDCGGSGGCLPCATAKACLVAGDCASGVCNAGTHTCTAPACTDVVKNGTETDIDCGGSCTTKCANTKGCAVAGDCASGVCNAGTHTCTAPACTDVVKNGTETDVDCGGSCSTKCANTKGCAADGDCTSGKCDLVALKCVAAACTDLVKNGSETDVDCGGAGGCAPCADTKACLVAGDCTSSVCDPVALTCTAPACNDVVKNGNETDIDCGGACATKCADTKGCALGSDCASGVCNGGACAVPACNDVVANGNETDIDCGGACATKCADTKGCALGSDCASGVCNGGMCAVPACNDTVKNGDETDVDCGGACGATCAVGKTCALTADCLPKSLCGVALTCACPTNFTGPTCEACVAGKGGPSCDYDIVYGLNIPTGALDYNVPANVAYDIDNAGAAGAFTRVAYRLVLGTEEVWVEMDAFTATKSNLGVPVDAIFDSTAINNVTVVSKAANLASVPVATSGTLEFWSNCYNPGGGAAPPVYDYKDAIAVGQPDCYGSMQVHIGTQTIFAFNRWSENNAAGTDLGFGNQPLNPSPSWNPDWTFVGNSGSYATRRLEVFVK